MNFWTILAVLFIGLKLGNIIHWSWLAVLSPLWGPWVFAFTLMIIAAMCGGEVKITKKK